MWGQECSKQRAHYCQDTISLSIITEHRGFVVWVLLLLFKFLLGFFFPVGSDIATQLIRKQAKQNPWKPCISTYGYRLPVKNTVDLF